MQYIGKNKICVKKSNLDQIIWYKNCGQKKFRNFAAKKNKNFSVQNLAKQMKQKCV